MKPRARSRAFAPASAIKAELALQLLLRYIHRAHIHSRVIAILMRQVLIRCAVAGCGVSRATGVGEVCFEAVPILVFLDGAELVA
jgi:hypothetical protein